MATFGKTNIGSSNEAEWFYDECYSWIYTAPASGDITKLSFYTKTTSGTSNIKVAIYSVSSGVPSSRLAISSAVTISTTAQWYDFSINLAITSGTQYAFAVGEGTVDVEFTGYRDVEGVTLNYQANKVLGASWTQTSSWNSAHSIYATYTPTTTNTTNFFNFI